MECEGEVYWIFPIPEDIAHLLVEDLDGLRMTVKGEYLIGVAQLMVEGKLTKERLKQALKTSGETISQHPRDRTMDGQLCADALFANAGGISYR